MKETKEETVKVQGAKAEKVKQKISVTYTLRTIGENGYKLKEAGLISNEDFETIRSIQEKAMRNHIGLLLNYK